MSDRKKPKQSQQRRQTRKPFTLPPNFAETVLKLELELETNCQMNTLKELLELYTVAIEYFEAKHDPVFLQYQKRIQALLTKQDVVTVMDENTSQRMQSRPPSPSPLERKCTTPKASLQPRHSQFKFVDEINSERGACKIVDALNSSSNRSFAVVKSHIKLQESSLQDRLASRQQRRKSIDPDMRRTRLSLPSYESDAGAGVGGHSRHFLCTKQSWEQDIEQVIERYTEERILKIQELKAVWLPQIEAISGKNVVDSTDNAEQLMQKLNEEISMVSASIEARKNAELDQLRAARHV